MITRGPAREEGEENGERRDEGQEEEGGGQDEEAQCECNLALGSPTATGEHPREQPSTVDWAGTAVLNRSVVLQRRRPLAHGQDEKWKPRPRADFRRATSGIATQARRQSKEIAKDEKHPALQTLRCCPRSSSRTCETCRSPPDKHPATLRWLEWEKGSGPCRKGADAFG